MDVNGTRFHLVAGRADWAARLGASPLEWDDARGAVTLAARLFRFPAHRGQAPLGPGDRRGAAVDRHGTWYWIDPERRAILCRRPAAGGEAVWWSVGDLYGEPAAGGGDFRPLAEAGEPPALPRLWGLAVTEHHYLVAGTREPGGLLVFDLHGGGPPVWQRWPAAVPFAPRDLAAAAGGGLWALDADTGATPRLWRLDRAFRVLAAGGEVELEPPREDDFRPDGGDARRRPGRSFPAGVSLELGAPLAAAAVAVAALPDGTALVLESDPDLAYSVIHRFDAAGRPVADPVALADVLGGLLDATPAGALKGHDFDFRPGPAAAGTVAGDLFVAEAGGDQAFAFALTAGATGLELRPRPLYLPLRRYTGKALVAAPDGDVYYDLGTRWLPLVAQPRARYDSGGAVDGLVFDGKEPGCVWHRLAFDAHVPPGDRVEVESRAADHAELLPQVPWQPEPRPLLRPGGSELPHHRPFGPGEDCVAGAGTWELLFQRAAGRFLELRLTLTGSGRSTPRLRALRVHYPRFSYLDEYLPAVYREDAASASFLDRFLANPEGIFTTLEGRVAAAQTLFDLRAAAPEALDWLAGWLGAVLDPAWDEARRRLFLTHAEKLFRWRGTRAGLVRAVRLAIDPCPDAELFAGLEAGGPGPADAEATGPVRIVEAFTNRGAAADGAAVAHRFKVLVATRPEESADDRARRLELVRAIVEREKPAHTAFDVELFWALLRVGEIRVGGAPPLTEGSRYGALALGTAALGTSYLSESHPWNVAERRVLGRDPLTET